MLYRNRDKAPADISPQGLLNKAYYFPDLRCTARCTPFNGVVVIASFVALFIALPVGELAAFFIPGNIEDFVAAFAALFNALPVAAGFDAALFTPGNTGELIAAFAALPIALLVVLVVVFLVAIILFLLTKKIRVLSDRTKRAC